jgi:YegS/Rv2252/BmrU family lipid kinase
MAKTVFVVNPNSANGSTARVWPDIAAAAKAHVGDFEVLFTKRMGHATELARQAAESGAELLVSVGGDGTGNEIVNGLMRPDGAPVNPQLELAIICMGTGGDFRKTAGIPKEFADAGGQTKTIDVGRMEMTNPEGQTVIRYFLNIASFGIGGDIDSRVNNSSKALGGFISFAWASITAMLMYKNQTVRIVLDDAHDLGERKIFSVAVANGQFFGGGMHVAPMADLSDGIFEVIVMGDFKLHETLGNMSKIYKAQHLAHPKVEHYRARKVTATSNETVLLDVDGEQPGKLPTVFTICPGALKLRTPA